MSDVAQFKEAIAELNAMREAKGVDINGKLYSKVSDRVEVFRKTFGGAYGIDTTVTVSRDFGATPVVIVSAKIMDTKTGVVAGSGNAMGFFGSDEVNTTSVVEATETSAIGRALASFGFAGGEFASANEMEALPVKQAAVKMSNTETRVVRQGSKEPPRSEAEREFRDAVDKTFPPMENAYEFFIPQTNSKEEIDIVFSTIDRIETPEELTAYYHALGETMQWLKPEDLKELKSSFKERNNQLKGL